jgi:hypothetical protein
MLSTDFSPKYFQYVVDLIYGCRTNEYGGLTIIIF